MWRGSIVHGGGNVKCYRSNVTVGKLLKKIKIELSYDPETPLQGVFSKYLKKDLEKISVHPCSL